LPAELPPASDRTAGLLRERRAARWACALIPVAALFAIPVLTKYLLFLTFLKPPAAGFGFGSWSQMKPAMMVLGAIEILASLWLAGVELELRRSRVAQTRLPLAAVAALVLVGAVCLALVYPKTRWTFAEWAKVRAPNPSFARNTLFWEAREFEQFGNKDVATQQIDAVGSSQMNAAVDGVLLARLLPATTVEKRCLAGMGPMQYLTLQDRIAERGCRTIVCWLSEFDFYREDRVPINRIRWAATAAGTVALWNALEPLDRWSNRSELADLSFAAIVPIWRDRDHFRRTIFGYWWDLSRPAEAATDGAGSQLARSADFEVAKRNMAENVGDKQLVATNFRCFRRFAELCAKDGMNLIVFEGCSHPEIMKVYDPGFRRQTRLAMQSMAAEAKFVYVPADEMPPFTAADFGDAYHLNDAGRAKFTRYLADYLKSPVRLSEQQR
jgi:hypothetical protein